MKMQIYRLRINKNACIGCNICVTSCPINFNQLKEMGFLTKENGVILVKNGTAYDIFDESRKFNCDGCGVCQKFCPTNSIKIELVKVE
jgi:ferredoxin